MSDIPTDSSSSQPTVEPQTIGIELLRERARTLEAERAALMQTTLELQVLVSSLNTRLQIRAADEVATASTRPYVSQLSSIQVRLVQSDGGVNGLTLKRAQDLVARLIVQSQQAFFQAQSRNAFQARGTGVDMFAVVSAEAQYKRKIKQFVRELNDELPRIAELRTALGSVRAAHFMAALARRFFPPHPGRRGESAARGRRLWNRGWTCRGTRASCRMCRAGSCPSTRTPSPCSRSTPLRNQPSPTPRCPALPHLTVAPVRSPSRSRPADTAAAHFA